MQEVVVVLVMVERTEVEELVGAETQKLTELQREAQPIQEAVEEEMDLTATTEVTEVRDVWLLPTRPMEATELLPHQLAERLPLLAHTPSTHSQQAVISPQTYHHHQH